MQKIGGLRQTGSAWNDGEILSCFEGFRVYGQLIWMNIWLDFAFLGIVVMCFWWLDWLDLEFWDLWSCIFGILIDLIWSFGIYGHVFLGFWLTWFGVWEFTVKNLTGFFDCIWDFWICSQQILKFYNMKSIYLFVLLVYFDFLKYIVNLSQQYV